MTVKTTLWRPDTCGCEVLYDWDTDDPEDMRDHTLNSIPKKCEFHALLSDVDCYETILNENITKNLIVNQIANADPESYQATTLDGVLRFDKNNNPIVDPSLVKYEFDSERTSLIINSANKVKITAINNLDNNINVIIQ